MRPRAAFALLGATAIAVAVFLRFPDLDLVVARTMLRPDGHFLFYFVRFYDLLHASVQYLAPVAGAFFVIAAIAHFLGRPIWGITAWQALFVVVAFAIGPGLLVNTVIKDNSHRPRPGDVREFGGELSYAPPFAFDGACDENCSFVAGDPAMGFAFLAPALLLPARRRRIGIAASLLLGGSLGLLRMLMGGHFLSDVIFSALVVWATVLVLHWAMFKADGAPYGRLGRRLSA
jgi:lipid A 4'-phosphatase